MDDAKDRIDVELLGALLRISIISALNPCIDEGIEPFSLDRLRGIVTLKVRARAT